MVGRKFLALAIALIASRPDASRASPRSDPTAGRAVFTGATLPTDSSVTLNPAALGLGHALEVYLGLSGLLEQFGVNRKVLGEDGSLSTGDSVHDIVPGAGASAAVIWHPGQITTLGAELRLPPPELFPKAGALRYHTLGSYKRNYVASGGVSLKVASAFLFGVSISHDITDLHLRYARDTALDHGLDADCNGARCGLENPAAAETYNVHVRSDIVSTENLEVNVGILIHPSPGLWFGLAYHNTPGFGIQTELHGTADVERAARDGGSLLHGRSTVDVSYPASVDGELRIRVLPDLDIHFGGRWEDLSRMQAYDVRTYGSEFIGRSIPEWTLRPRGFRDSFSTWLGAEQVEIDQTKRIRLGGRIGLESPALTANRTSPGNMSSTSLTVDLGTTIRIAPQWSIQLTYGLQVFSNISVTTSDYNPLFAVDCTASGFDYSTRGCEALRDGYAIPTAAGDYTRLQHAFRLGFRYERL